MILEKLHIIISLFAGIVITILCIVMKYPLEYSATILIITIVTSFIIGFFLKIFLSEKIFKEEQVEEENEIADSGSISGETEDEEDMDD